MVEFNDAGKPVWKFSGKDLLNGQTDGSSFPNGGLRATHRAGAYLTVDPESPPFIMPTRVSSESAPLRLPSMWHLRQFSARIW